MEMDKVTICMKFHTSVNKKKNEKKGILLDVIHQIDIFLAFFRKILTTFCSYFEYTHLFDE